MSNTTQIQTYNSFEEIKAASLILDEVLIPEDSIPKDCYRLLATSEITAEGLFKNTEYGDIDKVLIRISKSILNQVQTPTQRRMVLVKVTSLDDIARIEKLCKQQLIISIANRTIEIYDDYRE